MSIKKIVVSVQNECLKLEMFSENSSGDHVLMTDKVVIVVEGDRLWTMRKITEIWRITEL